MSAALSRACPAWHTPRDAPDHAVLIGLDWGTTSLRAYLFNAAGGVMAVRTSNAGIMNLPGGAGVGRLAHTESCEAAFENVCGAWLDSMPDLPIIAAGMVGSAQGWAMAPYVETPAGVQALVADIVPAMTKRGATVYLVPGVIEHGRLPNVMRGEETQIMGALEIDAQLCGADAPMLIGLPGTHAKWVIVNHGRIACFYTFMTGELFATLRAHTILGRTMADPISPDIEVFLRGVALAQGGDHAGMLATIFSVRTLGLTEQLRPDQQPDYLSGLLIGHELCGLATTLKIRQGVSLADEFPRLIGDAMLCERYRLALAEFGCLHATLAGAATEQGLWRIAREAGLIKREPTASTARKAVGPLDVETNNGIASE